MTVANDPAAALTAFVAWCGEHIRGDEKGEAQLFLDHLFRALGHAGLKEAGTTCCNNCSTSIGWWRQRLMLARWRWLPVCRPPAYPDPARLLTLDCLGAV